MAEEEPRPISPLEGVSFSSILRRGGKHAEAIARQVAQNYEDFGRHAEGALNVTPPGRLMKAWRDYQIAQRGKEEGEGPSFRPAPFAQPSSDLGVQAGAMALDPMNLLGATATTKLAAAAAPLARKFAPKVAEQVAEVAAPRAAELGLHPTTTAGRIVNATREGGGYSVNLPTGARPTEGLMMGKYANTDPRNLVTDALTRAKLAEMVQTNKGALAREDAYLGTWKDPAEGGKTYVDVSRRFPTEELRQATKYGERTGQLAGYDVGKGEQFPVGNWEEFVRGPQFEKRLGEMATEGRDYLSQFPAKEWWDMRGGPFERVYGQENLPQVAGFTASTAPNAAPRENLQTMSEYLRRHLKGEPTIQPEWRVPEGMMTRQPGKQIGMEQTRRANLERSSRGAIGELQADKVREEAQALMGDPNAVVLDRHWARVAEDPASGVYTSAAEGVVEPGKQYQTLKAPIVEAARKAGRDPRDYSADVWTGIRERIKRTSELYGQKYRKGSITGESKSYADQFEDLIADKAKHLGITKDEMERRLRSGDATLLSLLGATTLLAPILHEVLQQPQQLPAGRGAST